MKKTNHTTKSLGINTRKNLSLLFILIVSTGLAFGQAFDASTKIISIGLGGSSMYHIPSGYNAYYANSYFSPITGELTVQGEFAVYKYVGVGFSAGIGGRAAGGAAFLPGYYGYYGHPGYYTGYYSEFNVPVAVIANFHFYQLIADKVSNGDRLHADKLDIYAGVNLGSGVAIHPGYVDANGNKHTAIDALAYGGVQLGARYYFTPKIAVFGEFGWGKTWANAGITFKL